MSHPVWVKMLFAVIDSAFGAAIVLWIVRKIKG
jgi:uncharacterized membrane protein YeaQ/YmgE (transglycosylase-associated protein family)